MQHPVQDSYSEPRLELTPLIDVVFVVLVCFMLTAPFLELDNVALATNEASSDKTSLDPQSTKKLQIFVHDNDTIWIRNTQVADKDLPATLQRLRQQQNHGNVLVFHDRRAKFGTYEWLKGELSKAGFEKMEIALDIPPKQNLNKKK